VQVAEDQPVVTVLHASRREDETLELMNEIDGVSTKYGKPEIMDSPCRDTAVQYPVGQGTKDPNS
jgi:hypothetical protein